jgi:glycosyltransferase involved in cell wall biosynthesis
MSQDLVCDARWIGAHGIGRFAREVLQRLDHQPLPLSGSPAAPADPWRVGRVLRRLRPRLYFTPGFNPPWRSPVPFVLTLHDLIHLNVPDRGRRLRRLYYQGLVRPAARRAAAVLTVSRHSAGRIAAWAGIDAARVIVVGNGVSSCFTPRGRVERPGWPYVLFVGSAKRHKNLAGLLAAWAAARLAPELRLVVAGPVTSAFLDGAAARDLEERVRFLGTVDDEALAGWYRGAEAVACPSLEEGFGLVPIEAMACGTPVLAAARSALPEVTGDAALLVDPERVADLARGLERVTGEEPLRGTLRQRGLERASAFDWEGVAQRVRAALWERMAR